jgi:TM2 domain-containing membrane protein YozV
MASPAWADEIDDFNRARTAWDTSNYAEAIERLEPLLGSGPGALTDELLIRDARVYYAASLVMEHRPRDAEVQFELLLRAIPDYEIDPVAYPTAVVDLFRSVHERIADELRAEQIRKEEERRRREEEARRRREAEERRRRVQSAVYLERVVLSRQPVFMAFPFGVGQFVNGQTAKGMAFLTIEATLLVLNIGSYLVESAIEALKLTAANAGPNETIEAVAFYTNVTSLAALVVTAGIGILDAFVQFRGEEVRWQRVPRRQVPSRYQITMERGAVGLRF